MAEIAKSCSVGQAYNFQKDKQDTIGHITKLKIGDKQFTADTEVTNPTDLKGAKVKVVGIGSNLFWGGGYADGIQFSCQISIKNKQEASMLVHSDLSNTEVHAAFTCYDFDPIAKVYFKSFHTNDAEIKGLVQKSGSSLAIAIDTSPSSEIVQPENYAFSLGVMPQNIAQDVHLGFANDMKVVKKWGVAIG